ncbi:MAG: leucine-rich repeat protein [Anaerovoracaceae bacterium]|jgi:uncharacterized protein YjdB
MKIIAKRSFAVFLAIITALSLSWGGLFWGGDHLSYADDDLPTSGTCGENLTWTLDEQGTLTISGTGKMTYYSYDGYFSSSAPWIGESYAGSVRIKNIVIEQGVTSIGSAAFGGCVSLESIDIPDSVTSIENRAFTGCNSLESIEIPDGVKYIGWRAFEGCSALESIEIPDSVTIIDDYAFEGCSALESIDIPNSVTSIGEGAFKDCSVLKSIEIPDSVTIIESSTFFGCSAIKSIEIPDSVKYIRDYAFTDCGALESIEIPDGVKYIAWSAFEGCSVLQLIEIPDGVERIEDDTFEGCSVLQSIEIPDSVTSIGRNAFKDCSALQSIKIPDKVWFIGESAFEGCSSLQSIEIPDNVTRTEGSAFEGCSALTDIYYGGTEEQWNALVGDNDDIPETTTIHYNSTMPDNPTTPDNPDTSGKYGPIIDKFATIDITATPIPKKLSEMDGTVTYQIAATVHNNDTDTEMVNPSVTLSNLDDVTLISDNQTQTIDAIPGGGEATAYWTVKVKSVNLRSAPYPSFTVYLKSDNSNFLGSRFSTNSGKNKIIFNNYITDGDANIGQLQSVNVDQNTVTISGKTYKVTDDYYLYNNTSPQKIIDDNGSNALVLYNTINGKVRKIDYLSNALKPSVSMSPAEFSYTYSDGGYKGQDTTPKAEVFLTYKVKGYASDLVENLTVESSQINTISEVSLYIEGNGVTGKGTIFSGADNSDKGKKITFGSSNIQGTYQLGQPHKVGSIKLKISKEAPKIITEEITITSNIDANRIGTITINNNDIRDQRELLDERAKELSSELEDINLGLSLPEYFTSKQQKEIEKLLSLWLLDHYFSDEVAEEAANKIGVGQKFFNDRFNSALGISMMTNDKEFHDSIDIAVETTEYGTVNMQFTVEGQKFSKLSGKNPYTSFGTIEWEVTRSDKTMRSDAISGSNEWSPGIFTYAKMNRFEDIVKSYYESAIAEIYGNDVDQLIEEAAEKIVPECIVRVTEFITGGTPFHHIYKLTTTAEESWIRGKKTRTSIKCPVDVYVYNDSNELCGKIVNNVAESTSSDVTMSVEGDTKYVEYTGSEYFIKLVGNDTGTMEYDVDEIIDGQSVRTVTYENIPLTEGKTYNGRIPNVFYLDNSVYRLTGDNEESVNYTTDTLLDQSEATVEPTTLTLPDSESGTSITNSGKVQLIVTPSNASTEDLVWTSSDPSIATVDNTGTVTALKDGTVTITVKTKDGKLSASIKVDVTKSDSTQPGEDASNQPGEDVSNQPGESVAPTELKFKDAASGTKITNSGKLNLTVEPSNASTEDLVWTSSDPSIATVDNTGTVTALKDGTVTITVKTKDGKLSASIKVEVTKSDDTSSTEVKFTDVQESDWFYDAVYWAVAEGITEGTSETTFSPDNECTRSQIVTFLWRANGSPEVASTDKFSDVSSDQYYAKAVAWAVKQGITVGTSDTTFSPEMPCTRAQAVTFLWRANESPSASASSKFNDVDSSQYYADAVNWAVKNKITVGTSDTTFSPDVTCSRAQIVAFLYRAK